MMQVIFNQWIILLLLGNLFDRYSVMARLAVPHE